ncbi:MAG TPA: NUDIX domain-containing protein [Candidatus Limnocylindria bacterium]
MTLHADAFASLAAWQPSDPRQDELRVEFLDLLRHRSDALDRSCAPAHLTASALVLEAGTERVLLVLHRKIGRWIQPGGHAEVTDATLAGAALREATEESGITGLTMEPWILHLDRHPAPCRPGVVEEHFDVRYAVVAPAAAEPIVSGESLDVRWFDRDALPDGIEPTILAMIGAADRRRSAQRP